MELQKCISPKNCMPNAPQVVFGSKASSADVNVENAAYREFLFRTFNVSTVDLSSAAVAVVSETD